MWVQSFSLALKLHAIFSNAELESYQTLLGEEIYEPIHILQFTKL